MSVQTSSFVRKPFYVDALQVTEENMGEVASWCRGEIRRASARTIPTPMPAAKYIKVDVTRAQQERQTMAFVGDWILRLGSGYKVYTRKAFERSFEPVREDVEALLDEVFPETVSDLAGNKYNV